MKALPNLARSTIVVFGVAVIGFGLLLSARAALQSVSIEPEFGERQNGAIVADSQASGGQAVQFGSSAVSPWTLYWSDEFDGSSVNTSVWHPYHSTYGDGNFEIHCLTPNNVSVSGGTLKIVSRQETVSCPSYGRTTGWATPYRNYTSGFVGTRETGTYFPKYARYEIRAKSPQRLGLVPAIWLRHINGSSTMELDVMESFQASAPGSVTSTIHAQNSSGTFGYNIWKGSRTVGTSQDWRVWAVEIEPINDGTEVEIRYYLDGTLMAKNGGGGNYRLGGQGKINTFDNIGNNGFDIALNVAVSFNHSGNPAPDEQSWYCPSNSGWTKVSSPSQAQAGWKVAETAMRNPDGSTFYRACTLPQATRSGVVRNNPSGETFEIDYVRVYTR